MLEKQTVSIRENIVRITNEYLIIICKESSDGFYSLCKNVKRFEEFITTNSNITINNCSFVQKSNKFEYSLRSGEVKGKEQRFFYIKVYCTNEDRLENYKELLRELRSIFHTKNMIFETLRDDLSFLYAQKAYSLIYKIENLMRKFITYFMITTIGTNWVEETSPEKVKTALVRSKRKEYIDTLQQLDFIHLGQFLFNTYQEDDISNLFKKIRNISDSDKIDIKEIKAYIPLSNWEKYFNNAIDCSDDYLNERWNKIYDLRNKVAHTSHFSEDDYNKIKSLIFEVMEKLENAFEKIDSITLLQEDKDNITTTLEENVKSIRKRRRSSRIISSSMPLDVKIKINET